MADLVMTLEREETQKLVLLLDDVNYHYKRQGGLSGGAEMDDLREAMRRAMFMWSKIRTEASNKRSSYNKEIKAKKLTYEVRLKKASETW